LAFASLDHVIPDVDRLLAGHITVGNWSLGQICDHLARSITYSLEGFPVRAPWLLRKTLGPLILRRILKSGHFVEGMTAPRPYQPKPVADAQDEAEGLRAAIRRFATHDGPPAEHPLAGAVSRSVWERFHCIHCAHHLGFVLPVERGGAQRSEAGLASREP
jgi:hypothetical protein